MVAKPGLEVARNGVSEGTWREAPFTRARVERQAARRARAQHTVLMDAEEGTALRHKGEIMNLMRSACVGCDIEGVSYGRTWMHVRR